MAKFPYKGYSKEELNHMENTYYFLILGGDFVSQNDIVTFSKQEIKKLYNQTLRNLVKLTEEGDARDGKYGVDLIGSLRIVPVRVH